MAKDMIDAILQAEEECKQREAKAKSDAAVKNEQAHKDAQRLIDSAVAQAKAEAEELFAATDADGKKLLSKAKASAEAECSKISQTAEKNRKKVIKAVADMLTA